MNCTACNANTVRDVKKLLVVNIVVDDVEAGVDNMTIDLCRKCGGKVVEFISGLLENE